MSQARCAENQGGGASAGGAAGASAGADALWGFATICLQERIF